MSDFLNRTILGHRSAGTVGGASQPPGVVVGRVQSVSAAGVKFTIPEWDSGRHVFGPAPWNMSRVESAGTDPHDHPETNPPTGAQCLVIFVPPTPQSPGLRPVIVAWWT